MLTDNRLKIFVSLAETGSFTAAARQLGISQPAVSQCAAQLESAAGTPLLVRSRGRITLTPAGERFLSVSRRILTLYDSLTAPSDSPRQTALDLGDGRTATVSSLDGKLLIDISK